MALRLQLQSLLKDILGSANVYFQPPDNKKLEYPCIIYKRDDQKTRFADNIPYYRKKRYQIKIIDADPDSEIPEKIAALPLCDFDRSYTADNLNHDVYNLFF